MGFKKFDKSVSVAVLFISRYSLGLPLNISGTPSTVSEDQITVDTAYNGNA